MIRIDSSINCCGGAELHGLDHNSAYEPVGDAQWCRAVLLDLYDEYGWSNDIDEGLGWLVMSTVVVKKRRPNTFGVGHNIGSRRMRYLSRCVRNNKLGSVSIQRGTTYNPNSTNRLRTAIWHLDCTAIKKYVEKKEWRKPQYGSSWSF